MAKIYRKVYRDEVKAIGADAAYFLAELRAYAEFCQKNNLIDDNGFFELSAPRVEEMTGFDRFKQIRIIEKLTASGEIEKEIGKNNIRYIRLSGVRICNTRCANLQHQVCENTTPGVRNCNTPYYNKTFDKSYDKNVSSFITENDNKNTLVLVRDYFIEKGQAAEAAKFIKYNRENFGEDHITPDNYKKLADTWIKAKRNPPKKKRESGRGKTAREVAEDRGVTVDELFKTTGPPEATTGEPEKMDPFITELFGG